MSYRLLLTSKGIVPEIRKDFLSLLPKKKPENNKVAFITTAAYGENKDPHWLQKDRQLLLLTNKQSSLMEKRLKL